MFIVKKKIGNKEYYYLRESRREGGKVIAKTIAYLGKTRKEAERKMSEVEMNGGKLEKKDRGKELKGEKVREIRMKNNKTEISIDDLATYCKRKGFVYPSGELYGGLAGFWDFGPAGVEILNNIKKEWWKFHVQRREDIVGIDGAIVTNPKIWEASGHVASFVDYAVYNKKIKEKFKVDKHELSKYENNKDYEIKGEFNPMFTTQVGPVVADSVKAYLRPETAQLIFADFKEVWENARLRLPCGIAQVGKAFRNEISPREFLFRAREFEQMEIEYFIAPGQKCPYIDEIKGIEIVIFDEKTQKEGKEGTENKNSLSRKLREPQEEVSGEKMEIYNAFKKGIIKTDWHAYWMAEEMRWFIMLGANPLNFRARQHTSEERSHYAIDTWDLEYKFPMGWRELQGFANRGTWDLGQHSKHSGKNLEIVDAELGRVLPEVVCEPSLGVGRAFIVFMLDAYEESKERENTVLHLSPKLAPYKAGLFPLISKGEIFDLSRELFKDLKEEFNIVFDKSGSIGRRYARQDEIGTPYCITVDGDSLKDKAVTIRERDTTKQIRVEIKKLKETLAKLLKDEIAFEDAGKIVETRVK